MALTMNKLSQAGSTAEKVNILEGEISDKGNGSLALPRFLFPSMANVNLRSSLPIKDSPSSTS